MTAVKENSPIAVELRAAVRRYAELARSAGDGALPLAGSAWTMREAVAHVATVAPRYARFPQGTQRLAETPPDLPALNADEISELSNKTVGDLLSLLAEAVDAVISQVEAFGDEPPEYRFHGGCCVRADVALGILLGEIVVHGWDLARSMHRRWPITAAQTSLVWSGVEPVLPGWADPGRTAGHNASYAVHLGDGQRHVLSFTSGRLGISLPPGRRIDCHIGGDPAAILLILYRRRSPWRTALAGRVVAWGPRPWLAFTLADRFYLP